MYSGKPANQAGADCVADSPSRIHLYRWNIERTCSSPDDVADQVFKILNLLGTTHPFFVLRVSEIRGWIEGGDYDRILRGEYQRRTDPDPAYADDLAAAAEAYAEGAKGMVDQMAGAARQMAESVMGGFRR